MNRTFLFALLAVAAIGATQFGASDAYAISPNNPHRGYNLSGINYGSMQWEKQHRGTSTYGSSRHYSSPSRGFFFRRWR